MSLTWAATDLPYVDQRRFDHANARRSVTLPHKARQMPDLAAKVPPE